MKTIYLKYFKETYEAQLFNNTKSDNAFEIYYKEKKFNIDEDGVVQSEFKLSGDYPELIVDPKKPTKNEIDNAIKIYEFFNFNETLASDKRIWTYLTHTQYFNYVQERFSDPGGKVTENIRFHWFMRTIIRRNALAGLWWAVHQTKAPWNFDPLLAKYNNGDDFRFTRILLANQDLFFHLMERDLGKNPRLMAYFLIEVEKRGTKGIGAIIAKQSKYLTLVSNYRLLSAIGGPELTKVMQGLFK